MTLPEWQLEELRVNTDNSHHRYDVLLLINGVPVVHIELKTLGINPRRAVIPKGSVIPKGVIPKGHSKGVGSL